MTTRAPVGSRIRAHGRWYTVLAYAPDDDGTPAYWVDQAGTRIIILSCFVEEVVHG